MEGFACVVVRVWYVCAGRCRKNGFTADDDDDDDDVTGSASCHFFYCIGANESARFDARGGAQPAMITGQTSSLSRAHFSFCGTTFEFPEANSLSLELARIDRHFLSRLALLRLGSSAGALVFRTF